MTSPSRCAALAVVLLSAACAPMAAGLSARRMLITLYSVSSGSARTTAIQSNLNSANKAIGPTLCRQKMLQMNVSAFSFFRGSNELYYQDLKNKSTISATGSSFYSATATPWLQGDFHALNIGTYDNDAGTVIFDLNDFDESFVGNFLYDVYRLAASIVLVGRENSMTDTDIRSCVKSFVNFYCDKMSGIKQGTISDSTVLTASNTYGRVDDLIINAAASDTRKKMLDKYSTVVNSKRTFMTNAQNPDLDAVNATERTAITNAMTAYFTSTVTSSLKGNTAYFAVQDVARRLNAGTGSLGKSRYYVIIQGATSDASDDRILDVKLQGKPSVYPYLTSTAKAAVDNAVANDADRAVKAYKALIKGADNHLGYMSFLSGFYSVRERSPFKESLDTTGVDLSSLTNLAEQWGWALANAHARSDGGLYGTPASIESIVYSLTNGVQDTFKTQVADFAIAYGNQVSTDFSLFRASLAGNKLCL
ncbi:hypothetical protein TSOC_004048 [Tetrabaena socialis]|uniref:DUF2252 domain-containing protein n=1 Tax=Tetrabaena socialis TaxID=47790 RepID=A0A2J8AA09_9CHLO|nr:hypothetical protein TSOC_004048 [Tetrabaena socialis]|eukprot:PNH09349.1 hypothetical protein TSOC_004048 [Tetrabaena socialis]